MRFIQRSSYAFHNTPPTLIENVSLYGNFSQTMYKVLKASVPSVRCSRVDEQILFIVAHRVADIHCLHSPAVTLKLHIE